jgi:hypothetical protein
MALDLDLENPVHEHKGARLIITPVPEDIYFFHLNADSNASTFIDREALVSIRDAIDAMLRN